MIGETWVSVFVPAVIVLSFTVSILPIVLAFGHSRRKLELNHAERMKEMELGRPVSGRHDGEDEPWTMAARLAISIGVVVPLGSLACAFFASATLGFQPIIWGWAGMVGIAGVLCGGMLAGQAAGANKTSPDRDDLKPYVEEDAYDVVGARG